MYFLDYFNIFQSPPQKSRRKGSMDVMELTRLEAPMEIAAGDHVFFFFELLELCWGFGFCFWALGCVWVYKMWKSSLQYDFVLMDWMPEQQKTLVALANLLEALNWAVGWQQLDNQQIMIVKFCLQMVWICMNIKSICTR